MSTRAAIRPRPLDNNKPLLIVKDVSELDPDAQPLGADNGGHGSHVSFEGTFLQHNAHRRGRTATPRRQYNSPLLQYSLCYITEQSCSGHCGAVRAVSGLQCHLWHIHDFYEACQASACHSSRSTAHTAQRSTQHPYSSPAPQLAT